VVKAWPPEPLVYAALVTGLLLLRLLPERRKPRRDRSTATARTG
jgi:DMSO/TMAO reductase YedYZ heme-binding membrane subunit